MRQRFSVRFYILRAEKIAERLAEDDPKRFQLAGRPISLIAKESAAYFADELEKADDFDVALQNLVCKALTEHQRIIFNGNGYEQAWVEEAERRGLSNLRSTVDALERYYQPKHVDMFVKHGIYTKEEMVARSEIHIENYSAVISIEANTMIEMTRRQIIPAVVKYAKFLSETLVSLKDTGLAVDVTLEAGLLKDVSAASAALRTALSKLEKAMEKSAEVKGAWERAVYYRDKILPAMEALRAPAATLEVLLGKDFWPMPTYTDLMFGIL